MEKEKPAAAVFPSPGAATGLIVSSEIQTQALSNIKYRHRHNPIYTSFGSSYLRKTSVWRVHRFIPIVTLMSNTQCKMQGSNSEEAVHFWLLLFAVKLLKFTAVQ